MRPLGSFHKLAAGLRALSAQNGNGHHPVKVEQKTVEENVPALPIQSEHAQPETPHATPALTPETVAPANDLSSFPEIEQADVLTPAEELPLDFGDYYFGHPVGCCRNDAGMKPTPTES